MELKIRKRAVALLAVASLCGGSVLALTASSAEASTPRAGRYCTKSEVGKRVGQLVCVRSASGARYWKIVRKPVAKPVPTRTVTRTVTQTVRVTVTRAAATVTLPPVTRTVLQFVPGPTVTRFVECTPSSPPATGSLTVAPSAVAR